MNDKVKELAFLENLMAIVMKRIEELKEEINAFEEYYNSNKSR